MTSTGGVESAIDAMSSALLDARRCVIAVSGGVDSVVLAHAVAKRYGRRVELTLAHFNHLTRSADEHERDHRVVSSLARRLNVPLIAGRADEASFAGSSAGGPESRARSQRYGFLSAVALHSRSSAVLTAHTRDDQVETIVMRLLSGIHSGLLRGIESEARHKGFAVLRPLLSVSKEEIRSYAVTYDLQWCEDETNRSLGFRRNVVRNAVLPAARVRWPALDRDVLLIQKRFAAAAAHARHLAANIPCSVHDDRAVVDRQAFFSSPATARLQLLYDTLRSLRVLRRRDRPTHRFFAPLLADAPVKDGTLLEGRGVRVVCLGGALVISRKLSGNRNDGIFQEQERGTNGKGSA